MQRGQPAQTGYVCMCVCVSVNEDNEAVNRKVPLAGIRSTFHWHLPESSRQQNMCATPVFKRFEAKHFTGSGAATGQCFFQTLHRCFVSWGTEVEIWFEFQSPFGLVHGKHRNASCREGEPRVWWLRHYENLVCVCVRVNINCRHCCWESSARKCELCRVCHITAR